MYCAKCGAQISDDAAFCSACGAKTGSSDSSDTFQTMKDGLRKVAKATSDTVKAAGHKINEATDGKAGAYARKAKDVTVETTKDVCSEIKEVFKDIKDGL